MSSGEYTPGYGATATAFMERRTLESHAAFLRPLLHERATVLDVGCGPGTITIDIADAVAPGEVIGLDLEPSQVELACRHADVRGVENVRFLVGSIETLPLPDDAFDVAFAHALFEHLADPVAALLAVQRVVRPEGRVALRSPDWGGFIVAPMKPGLDDAIAAYRVLQTRNGGGPLAGRRLGSWLREAGFTEIERSATYEVYPEAAEIAEDLAERLEVEADGARHAASLRSWARHPAALFAQAWCEAIGSVPRVAMDGRGPYVEAPG